MLKGPQNSRRAPAKPGVIDMKKFGADLGKMLEGLEANVVERVQAAAAELEEFPAQQTATAAVRPAGEP